MRFIAYRLFPLAAFCVGIAGIGWSFTLFGQAADPPAQLALPRECLVLPPVGRYGRLPLPNDALVAQIVAGTWKAPKAGDTVPLADGSTRAWEAAKADDKGVFSHASLRGGYAFLTVTSDSVKAIILEASGHAMVYVNGEPRAGDIYQNGIVKVPILLKKGTNELLFHCVRGQLNAKLTAPSAEAVFSTADVTLPSLRIGDETPQWGALPVINATAHAQEQLAIEATLPEGKPLRTAVPLMPPGSTRKVGFQFAGRPPKPEGDCPVELKLVRKRGDTWETLDTAKLMLGVRKPEQKHKRTFLSEIDGSVQYFSVVPPLPVHGDPPKEKPALVLTLHGAAVEGDGQAACFSHKENLYTVAATNRRPYGFDWEDWGRLDAMEVLDLAEKIFGTDPRRTYLTGHSMGGHGTWHIGATYPGRFAAIGPSAGWISMWSYAGVKRSANPSPIQELIFRAAMPSDTLVLAPNLANYGVYVLHGDKDDNVPVEQAREMKKVLESFHKDFAYHEQVGAGHWWGNPCVDWPAMAEFFAKHVQPETKDVRQVDFITASPGVSAQMHWATIEAQIHAMKPSSIHIKWDPEKRSYVGTTENVARLSLEIGYAATEGPVNVELDGTKMEKLDWRVPLPVLFFQRSGDKWSEINLPSRALKSPARCGPFRDAFRHRMIFVYGTHGKPEENAWAYAKARYDAETFWYRGNGSIDLVADSAFDAKTDRNRNVILYGNATTNSAWNALLADSPVQVDAGKVRIGEREETGTNLACLFLRPRPGSDTACVAVVGGSGLAGMRLTDQLPYFVSGVGYPDCLLFDTDTLTKGGDGVRAAGYFGVDWGVTSGEFAWRN